MMEVLLRKIDSYEDKFKFDDAEKIYLETLDQNWNPQLDELNESSEIDVSSETDELSKIEELSRIEESSEIHENSWLTVSDESDESNESSNIDEVDEVLSESILSVPEFVTLFNYSVPADTETDRVGNRNNQSRGEQEVQPLDADTISFLVTEGIQRLSNGENNCIPLKKEVELVIKTICDENNLQFSPADKEIKRVVLKIWEELIGISRSKREEKWNKLCEKYSQLHQQKNYRSVSKRKSTCANKTIQVLQQDSCDDLRAKDKTQIGKDTSQDPYPSKILLNNHSESKKKIQFIGDKNQDPFSSKTLPNHHSGSTEGNQSGGDESQDPCCSKTLSNNHSGSEDGTQPGEDESQDPCCSKTLSNNHSGSEDGTQPGEDESQDPCCSKTLSNNHSKSEETQFNRDDRQDSCPSKTLPNNYLGSKEETQFSRDESQDPGCSKTEPGEAHVDENKKTHISLADPAPEPDLRISDYYYDYQYETDSNKEEEPLDLCISALNLTKKGDL